MKRWISTGHEAKFGDLATDTQEKIKERWQVIGWPQGIRFRLKICYVMEDEFLYGSIAHYGAGVIGLCYLVTSELGVFSVEFYKKDE